MVQYWTEVIDCYDAKFSFPHLFLRQPLPFVTSPQSLVEVVKGLKGLTWANTAHLQNTPHRSNVFGSLEMLTLQIKPHA